ncbi:P-loop NTPase fold protein [Candidatus Mesenet endosymbiont of Phosphuga atrata]|uniref:P-loop NTPase fold protein n=1 Tax=Candidatus Mesenet endosymbiont of Phosphuga atrata TaxID=3066221 RepID=UPI0030D4F8C7
MFSTFFQQIRQLFKKRKVEEKKYEAWQEDCLEYQSIAINFTKIIKVIKDQHHIISLEADPGLGKTFFLQNWALDLKEQNEIAVYYDAWNINALEQPLAPLLSFMFDNLFISKKIKKSIVRKFKNINDQLFSLDTLGKLINKSPLGIFSVFVDVTKEAEKKERSEISLNELTAYNTRRKNMEDFKTQFTEIVNKIRNSQNIYVLVDNLELCRTKYIIDFFEYIKYSLNIDGLVFILATHKSQSNVKKTVNTSFGMQERFVDLSLFLPRVPVEKFINKQFQDIVLSRPIEEIKSSFTVLCKIFLLSLKDVKRCVYAINLLFLVYPQKKLFLPNLFSFLIILQLVNHELYESLGTDILSITDFFIALDKPVINNYQQEWQDLKAALETSFSNINNFSPLKDTLAQLDGNEYVINYMKRMIAYVV